MDAKWLRYRSRGRVAGRNPMGVGQGGKGRIGVKGNNRENGDGG